MTDRYRTEVIDPGDAASAMAKELCFKTHQVCKAATILPREQGNFRGAVDFRWKSHILQAMLDGKMAESFENDGAGGKPQFFTLVGTRQVFRNLGWEIIEMAVEDLVRSGRFPVIIDNMVEAKRVTDQNFPYVKAMFEGYAAALRRVGVVNITGELAIMKHSVTAFCDDGSDSQLIVIWGASCIGLSHEDLYLDGSAITPELPIVGFWEPGYRCNGGTFFTNLLLQKFGPSIIDIRNNREAMALARQLCVPSQNYSRTMTRVLGWQRDGQVGQPLAGVAGIAHVTGGGVWGKLGDLLPEGVGAKLDNMPEPAPVLRQAQELSWDIPDLRLTDLQAHGTLHGGCGMFVVCKKHIDAREVITQAAKDNVQAKVVGLTTESPESEITILSRFKEGRLLSSRELEGDD